MKLNVNDREVTIDADPAMPLLWALRDVIGLTGTKFGCGVAQCGACTVHLDGEAVRSCITPVSDAAGKKLTTIEAATDGADRIGAAVHAAWVKHDVAQCGYCQSGQIMSAIAFLKSLPPGQLRHADHRFEWTRPQFEAWAGALVLVTIVLLCSLMARLATYRLESMHRQ